MLKLALEMSLGCPSGDGVGDASLKLPDEVSGEVADEAEAKPKLTGGSRDKERVRT